MKFTLLPVAVLWEDLPKAHIIISLFFQRKHKLSLLIKKYVFLENKTKAPF